MALLNVDPQRIARSLGLRAPRVARAIELLDSGATAPFITRYRRDATGGMDEAQVVAVRDALAAERRLEQRKATVLRSIESQGRLTPQLREAIDAAESIKLLDDLYLPFKPKKQTLAHRAREQGLEPLAEALLAGEPRDLQAFAARFVGDPSGAPSVDSALQGAGHILAERFSEDAALRRAVRRLMESTGLLVSKRAAEEEKLAGRYRDFWDFRQPLATAPPHRVLAINRGEREGALRVSVELDSEAAEGLAVQQFVPPQHPNSPALAAIARDSVRRFVVPSLAREARRDLTQRAEAHAVEVFARNLRGLLMQPPLVGRRVLAIDPGYKNGCKYAALDPLGRVLESGVVWVLSDQHQQDARLELGRLIRQHGLNVVAIGNGSACRQTEQLVAEMIGADFADEDLAYVIVNEAGASVYSTSSVGREELPELDPMQRSAVSIGRRLQDPLSELVKIDPASLGVGLYQHDAPPGDLRDALDDVVRSCVSFVGVDINSASPSLLRYVSGLNQLTARRICEHRERHGRFDRRETLLTVPGLGPIGFQQSAGFLKIEGGPEPLDATWVHPEDYPAARRLLDEVGVSVDELRQPEARGKLAAAAPGVAANLCLGLYATEQLVDALERPGRDPRAELPAPVFRRNIVRIDDLHPGIELRGNVVNVVDFGAFVDIGLSDSALLHVSQMSGAYVRDPHRVVSVGDPVRVWVTAVDPQRRRVSLTMIEPTPAPPSGERRESALTEGPSKSQHSLEDDPGGEPVGPMRSFSELLQRHRKQRGGAG